MSLSHTPYVKTRQQKMRELEQKTNNSEKKEFDEPELKSEKLFAMQKKIFASEGSASTHTSSVAARKRLELEAARKRAEIDLRAIEADAKVKAEAATKKAEIEKLLVNKELDAELAELQSEGNSRKSVASSNEKVQEWLNGSRREMESEKVQFKVVADAAPRTDIQELAAALQTAISTSASKSQNQELLTRLATSKDLPIFFGDPLEWLQFKNAFYESSELCNYSPTENMWRLRKCLRGEAKETVSSLLIGCSSPQDILNILELRFGRLEIIMNKIVLQLKKLSPLPQTYHCELVQFSIKIKNYVAAASAIRQTDYLRSPELVNIIVSKLPTLLVTKWADYSYTTSEKPKLERLSDFLYLEANKIATSGVSFVQNQSDHYKRKPEYNRNPHQHVLAYTNNELINTTCMFCKTGKHALEKCSKYRKALRKDRWQFARTQKLCYKCLRPRHVDISTCTAPACDVEGCDLPHHRLLHWVKKTSERQEPAAEEAEQSYSETVHHATALQCKTVPKVLLKIVPVTVHGSKGSVHTHALLDDGSTVTLISADLANEVELHGETMTMRARGAWDSGELVCKTEIVNFDVSNCNNERFNIQARKINELNLPIQCLPNIDLTKYKYFDHDIDLCKGDTRPMLLIGQDNYNLIFPSVCVKGKSGQPYITKTPLGWCVHGTIGEPNYLSSDRFISHLTLSQCSADIYRQELLELRELIRKHFSLESIGICNKPRRNAEDLRAIEILDKTCEFVDGHWTVGLPWKQDDPVLPYSYSNALIRLKSVVRKMEANEPYALRYKDRIDHLFKNNYARAVSAEDTSKRIWYLPHFGVDNPNKNKLRLVFDAAAQAQGSSLNDFLLQGPDLLNSLFGIMFRFRERRIAVVGDIMDMFLCVKVRYEDQHALRFLWKGEDGSIKEYTMTSLIFGANCSPFVAQYINQTKNASRFQKDMPDAVHAIQNSQYMDDYIDSLEDEDSARKIVKEVAYIHQQGGFYMRNWMSNEPRVLQDLPKEDLRKNMEKVMLNDSPERTLGLLWYPATDMLAFDLSFKRIPNDILNFSRKPTKREVLRIVMSIFDIHGFLAPITIKGKIIMQQTWKLNIEWNEKINDDLFKCFQSWIAQLQKVSLLRIPRCYFSSNKQQNKKPVHTDNSATKGYGYDALSAATVASATDSRDAQSIADAASVSETKLELHVFCDASPDAYAAVAYWRKQCSDGSFNVSFIGSKSRVTPPSKAVTIPRLELQGAVLACRLADSIKKEHRLKVTGVFYWTDSTTVLHWIRNNKRNYKVFIANRLGDIDEFSSIGEWNYVPSEQNVADLATKNSNYELNSCDEWFNGPEFLYQRKMYWPVEPGKNKVISDIEEINIFYEEPNKTEYLPVPDPSRFSRWLRLLRATATVLLFIEKCKRKKIDGLTDELMHRGEILLLRHAQAQSFQKDIDLLKENKKLNANSRLRTLTPIFDRAMIDRLMRVDGRINAAPGVSKESKSPIILDGRHHTSRLIVLDYHIRAAHSCNELVVNELRQKYWLIKLRPTVRTVSSQCCFCRIRKANPKPARLGDLPEVRLNHHQRAFTVCGVDLFGPIEVTIGRQKARRYGVLFTCLTVRAVHIEIVYALTTDALIMALRRMAARRGWPKYIYSDNGTNLRGADSELKKAFLELDKEAIMMQAVNKGVDWRFIPPASPHMGGAWERLIRSVKDALRVVLNERSPKEEVLITLLAEIENMINSRPLTHVSVDPQSDEALTPNHFLIGSSSNLPQPGVFDEGDLYLRKQWRTAQHLADLFWNRWMKEVLPMLVPRQKWQQEGVQLKVEDLVVVVDPTSHRNCWPKGIIESVYPGKDGRVRVVDIRTRTGIMKRSVTRVALLFGYECRKTDTRGEDVDDGTLKS